ncbi:MAG: hypothetical protein KAS32_20340 [Candidatus Peribacteraceae bacterium]|nr:hypothetical protein [Candidatus Peribacteraceae bacterium]
MKFPRVIKIGGREFEVKHPYTFIEEPNMKGQIDFGLQEIRVTEKYISGGLSHIDNQKEALFHEILHGIDEVFNANGLNHDTLSRISEGVYQVLKDNPDFVGLFK